MTRERYLGHDHSAPSCPGGRLHNFGWLPGILSQEHADVVPYTATLFFFSSENVLFILLGASTFTNIQILAS